MGKVLKAAVVYFAVVFGVAFVLGVVRVLVVAPRLGPLAAVMIEAPLILIVSWRAARWCVERFRIPATARDRLTLGLAAFALLMAVELALSVVAFGQTPAEHFAAWATPAGALGLSAQMVFGLIPWLQTRAR